MTQYQIPEHIRESMNVAETDVVKALQRNIEELKKLQQVLEGIREEGFHKPPVQTQQPTLYLIE